MTTTLVKEISALRQQFDELARVPDDALENRYNLHWPSMPPGLYWQMRWLASTVLRGLERLGVLRQDMWPVSLQHATTKARAKPVVIWAVGTDRDTLRSACNGLARQWDSLPGFAPVLLTDIADFAFFSRLCWLVEYVPRLAGEGEPYEQRKMKFLARLYRGAAVLPVSVGLEPGLRDEELRYHVLRHA